MNRELLKLKKVLLEAIKPSQEEKLGMIFDIMNDDTLDFEDALNKFCIEIEKYHEERK